MRAVLFLTYAAPFFFNLAAAAPLPGSDVSALNNDALADGDAAQLLPSEYYNEEVLSPVASPVPTASATPAVEANNERRGLLKHKTKETAATTTAATKTTSAATASATADDTDGDSCSRVTKRDGSLSGRAAAVCMQVTDADITNAFKTVSLNTADKIAAVFEKCVAKDKYLFWSTGGVANFGSVINKYRESTGMIRIADAASSEACQKLGMYAMGLRADVVKAAQAAAEERGKTENPKKDITSQATKEAKTKITNEWARIASQGWAIAAEGKVIMVKPESKDPTSTSFWSTVEWPELTKSSRATEVWQYSLKDDGSTLTPVKQTKLK